MIRLERLLSSLCLPFLEAHIPCLIRSRSSSVEYGAWIANAYDIESTDHQKKCTDHLEKKWHEYRKVNITRGISEDVIEESSSPLYWGSDRLQQEV